MGHKVELVNLALRFISFSQPLGHDLLFFGYTFTRLLWNLRASPSHADSSKVASVPNPATTCFYN